MDKKDNKNCDFCELIVEAKCPCRNYLFSISLMDYIKKKLNINYMKFGTSEDFDSYESWLKEKHPYVYRLELIMDKFQNLFCFIPEKTRKIKSYITNRFITKTHYLNTKLEKGQWFDFDTRVFYGLMNEFQSYVENEVAEMNKILSDKPLLKERKDWTKRDWALNYFDWEINETSEHQSEAAKIKKEIYLWWLDVYPKRVDPYDLSSERDIESYHKTWNEIERQTAEDTEMLIKLIKVRGSCWT